MKKKKAWAYLLTLVMSVTSIMASGISVSAQDSEMDKLAVTEIKVGDGPNQNRADWFQVDQAIDSETNSYSVSNGGDDKVWVDVTTADSTNQVTCTAISGVYQVKPGEVIPKSAMHSSGWSFWKIEFDDESVKLPAKVKFTVTSADGKYSRDYSLTIYYKKLCKLPTITLGDPAVSERTSNSAKINLTTSVAGDLYYLTQETGMAPLDDKIIAEGKNVTAVKGANTLTLEDISGKEQNVYIVLKGSNDVCSVVKKVTLEGTALLGDVNGDGEINLSDAIALLNNVTAQESVDLGVGDVNGDGTVNLQDAIALLNQVTAQ